MQDRLSDKSIEVMETARHEAIDMGHGSLGTADVLLGLLRFPWTAASSVLARHGIGYEEVRREVERSSQPSSWDDAGGGMLPYGFELREARELIVGEAETSGLFDVWPVHILLGILSDPNWKAARVLGALGLDHGQVAATARQLAKSEIEGRLPEEGTGEGGVQRLSIE